MHVDCGAKQVNEERRAVRYGVSSHPEVRPARLGPTARLSPPVPMWQTAMSPAPRVAEFLTVSRGLQMLA